MTALVQHTLTKAEREARRAERAAQKERDRQAQEAALPDSVHGVPLTEMVYTAASKKELKAKRREFTPMRSAFSSVTVRPLSCIAWIPAAIP